MDLSPYYGVILGAVIAAVVSVGGEIVRGIQDSSLDSRKRKSDREIEKDRIQRNTLIKLQRALNAWMRVQAVTVLEDTEAFRATGHLGDHSDQLNADELTAGHRLAYLTERVKDDVLRVALTDLRAFSIPPMPADEAEVSAAMVRLVPVYSAVSVQLGEVLRTYL